MKKNEIVKFLEDTHSKLQESTYWKWFVSSPLIMDFVHKIEDFALKLDDESIQIETIVENDIQFCGSCGQKVSLRKMRIDSWMISWLIKCFNFVMRNKVQWFQIQEIDLIPQEYSKLNHLVRFWLLYKNWEMKNGEYWVPRKTVSMFLAWEWRVSEFYETDPTKKEWEEWRRFMSEKRISIEEIPSVWELKEQFWEKLVEYEWNEDFE